MKNQEYKIGTTVNIFYKGSFFEAIVYRINKKSLQVRFHNTLRGCYTITTIPYNNISNVTN